MACVYRTPDMIVGPQPGARLRAARNRRQPPLLPLPARPAQHDSPGHGQHHNDQPSGLRQLHVQLARVSSARSPRCAAPAAALRPRARTAHRTPHDPSPPPRWSTDSSDQRHQHEPNHRLTQANLPAAALLLCPAARAACLTPRWASLACSQGCGRPPPCPTTATWPCARAPSAATRPTPTATALSGPT